MKSLIAIPTYNEFGNITNLIESIISETVNFDILFIDDSSSDGTLELINKYKNLTTYLSIKRNQKKITTFNPIYNLIYNSII